MTNSVHLTRTGTNVMLDRFRRLASTSYTNEPVNIAWGTGGTGTETPGGAPPFTAAITDVGMFQEAPEARTAGSDGAALQTTTFTNDTFQVTGTITCTQGGGETITECGLFDSTTKPASSAVTTLISSSGTTSVVVASSAAFATAYPYDLQVGVEVMQVSNNNTGTNTFTVTRGQNGTTAQTNIPVGEIVTQGVAPGQTVITGNVCFLHASFTGLALNNNDSIAFTINVQLQPQ